VHPSTPSPVYLAALASTMAVAGGGGDGGSGSLRSVGEGGSLSTGPSLLPDGVHTRLISNPFQPKGTLRPLSGASHRSSGKGVSGASARQVCRPILCTVLNAGGSD
jgi:hypothetical protein